MNAHSESDVVQSLARERLLPFLILVFELLHPGKPPLKASWYLRAICYWLERIERGELRRSMIWLQPRALKSITVAVAFPCWLLGRDPTREVMIVTYSERLGETHAQNRRLVLDSNIYKQIFPNVVIARGGNKLSDVVTTLNGRLRVISVEGTATGLGANFIILDDCMMPEDAASAVLRAKIKSWFEGTISPRVIDEHSAIISIQQRIHEDDLPAFLLEKGFTCLCLPAVAPADITIDIGPGITHLWKRNELLYPERWGVAVLADKRIEHGAQAYSAQYLQDPVSPEGNLVPMEQLMRYEGEIPREEFDKVFLSVDCAGSDLPTADWSVCTVWGYLAGRLFLVEIMRQRLKFGPLKAAVLALRHKWRADQVIIENIGVGMSLCQELRRTGPFSPVRYTPRGDKAERFIAQTGQIEEGRVWLPASLPGLDTFLAELRAFPFGRYDDQIDTLTQVLDYIMFNWRSVETERLPSGRAVRRNRDRQRPPLPTLPKWLE